MSAADSRILAGVEFIVRTYAQHIARRFPDISREDVAQEGRRLALEALPSFDPNRGPTFVTFCYPRVVGGMRDFAAKEQRARARLFSTEVGIRDEEAEATSFIIDEQPREALVESLRGRIATYVAATELDARAPSVEDLHRSASREQRVRAAVSSLTKEDQKFVKNFYEKGLTLEDTATAMEISKRTATRIHQRVKQVLSVKLFEEAGEELG